MKILTSDFKFRNLGWSQNFFDTGDGEEGREGIIIAATPGQSYFKGSFISTWDAETQKIFGGRFSAQLGRSKQQMHRIISKRWKAGADRKKEKEKDTSVHVPWEGRMLSSKKSAFSNQLMSCTSTKSGYPKDVVQDSHKLLLELGMGSKF